MKKVVFGKWDKMGPDGVSWSCLVWSDLTIAQLADIPGVVHPEARLYDSGGIRIHADPRYDTLEIEASIEAAAK